MAKKILNGIDPNNPAFKLLNIQAETPMRGQLEIDSRGNVTEHQEQPAQAIPAETTPTEETAAEKQPITAIKKEALREYTQKKERKTKRLQLLITPTTEDKLQRMKEATGQSVNEFINNILEDVLQNY